MCKEEYRKQILTQNWLSFAFFPILLFSVAAVLGFTSDFLLQELELSELLLSVHLALGVSSLGLGAYATIGKELLDRRIGGANLLIASPLTLPLGFKTTFSAYYVKEIIFYVSFSITPVVLGLLMVSGIAGLPVNGIALLWCFLSLTFLYFVSVSFFLSTMTIRSVGGIAVLMIAFLILFFLQDSLGIDISPSVDGGILSTPVLVVVPSLYLQVNWSYNNVIDARAVILALIYPLVFSIMATRFVSVDMSGSETRRRNLFFSYHRTLSFLGSTAALVAKELIDVRRTNGAIKIFFSFLFPLAIVAFTTWFMRFGMGFPAGFNTVFFGVMIGFFGVMIYSWLNALDSTEYFATLPLTVPMVIKAKIRVFLVLTLWISTIFLVIVGIINDELPILPLGLLVMFVSSVYMVTATAYLTGLRTNTLLFNSSVLVKFYAFAFLPMVSITLLSIAMNLYPDTAIPLILLICMSLVVSTGIIYGGIERKWKDAEF